MELNKILCGDSLEVLKTFESESIDCCITSPPYWGLRDYGTAKWDGGDEKCDHKGKPQATRTNIHDRTQPDVNNKPDENVFEIFRDICGKCGAKRIDQQLGLEKTPEEYVAKLVGIFQEVKRVLKKEGTLWLNLGDSYAAGGNGGGTEKQDSNRGTLALKGKAKKAPPGLKPKDLVGIPWRVAFALQADGWYLRQDIIWAKPNPMPESVTDRCTKSHEYIFLLSKSPKYYFDNEAIAEDAIHKEDPRAGYGRLHYRGKREGRAGTGQENFVFIKVFIKEKRNKRSVWTVTTKPFKEAHFATFPEDLIVPMVRAGCPESVCKKCGKARFPIVKSDYEKKEVKWHPEKYGKEDENGARRGRMQPTGIVKNTSKNVGWTDCGCNAGFIGGIVLDPFMGAGTTGLVAKKLSRNYVGIELNENYIKIANDRIKQTLF